MSSALSVPESTDFETAMSTGKPTLIDFWAEWCGPCKQLSPVLDKIADEHPEFTVVKVNIEAPETAELARQHQVTGVPRMLIFSASGDLIEDWTGPKPKKVIVDALAKG